MPSADLQGLEAAIGYTFRERELLVRALTHRSFASETRAKGFQADNEQLEFFGDAILGFLISEVLTLAFPALGEGPLSRAKSHLVSARWLAHVAQRLRLGDFLQLGRGEERGGGRGKASLLANAIEALIAALYLDGGMEPARAFVSAHVYNPQKLFPADHGEHTNYKGELWEHASTRKLPKPEYLVIATSGPAHAPRFVIEARLGELYQGRGEGSSKKEAEQNAARALLQSIGEASTVQAS